MSPTEKTARFGPFIGTDQRISAADAKHPIESFNVEFIDGVMQRRKGRAPLMSVPVDFGPTGSRAQGMTEFVTKSGERLLISTHDIAGETRVYRNDLGPSVATPLQLPYRESLLTQPRRMVSYAAINGWLIGATTAGVLWRYDGTTIALLEALNGMDLQNEALGAESYLPATPRGTILEVYRNRLFVTGDNEAPLSFYASLEDNDITTIPENATVGGANVWPLKYVFTVPGKRGDHIVSAAVINDRYAVLTRSQIWVFDDVSLRLANGDIGCVSAGSVQRVDNLLFFLSDRGVFVFDSVDVVNISAPIERLLSEQVNWSAIEGCCSVHNPTKGEYWLWLPLNGEDENQIAVVYNYIAKSWRTVGGWYPFDIDQRRDFFGPAHNVTAACTVVGQDGKRVILTYTGAGRLWQEECGWDDDGKVYPAYAIFPPVSNGDQASLFMRWYVIADCDGQWYECFALPDGESFEQEIDRRFAGSSTRSEIVQKRALAQEAPGPSTPSQHTYQTVSGWPVLFHTPQPRKFKFGFGRAITKMQPVVHWPVAQDPTNLFPVFAARGRVHEFEVHLLDKSRR